MIQEVAPPLPHLEAPSARSPRNSAPSNGATTYFCLSFSSLWPVYLCYLPVPLQRWHKTRSVCPLCNKEWDFTKIEKILPGGNMNVE